MKTPQWLKKLGGHAGELYVAAELSKRGIPNALLPGRALENELSPGRRTARRFASYRSSPSIPIEGIASSCARPTKLGSTRRTISLSFSSLLDPGEE